MQFFAFLQELLITMLVSYLSFTNTLALYVESFLQIDPPPRDTLVEEVTSPLVHEPEPQSTFERTTSAYNVIPRVLLENNDYQNAALFAARLGLTASAIDNTVPLDERVLGSLVNIFCQYRTDDYIRTTTGTGFFVHPSGVILTNAHVAQFLLLDDADDSAIDTRCVIRTGNPAVARYEAELLYISPSWVFENAKLITEETPRGTGERDYALLYISKSIDASPLPARFTSLPVHTELLTHGTKGTRALTAGYPAGALQRDGSRATLEPRIATTTIGELYTFGSNYADVFLVSESPVGEQGASGGPVVREQGDVIGLIVTKGDEREDGVHSLRALTLSYVDRTIIEETGYSLIQNMQGDLAYRGAIFKQALEPFLRKLLTDEITATR